MKVSLIVAIAKNNVIGKDNQLIWHLPDDLKFFKKTTSGHHIISGRKNYESINRALPNRTNIIVTRNMQFSAKDCIICSSIDDALDIARKNGDEEAFIIGGGEIYKQSINIADKLYITHLDMDFEGDTFFPNIDFSIWNKISEEFHPKDEKHLCDFKFSVYERYN